jgi:transcriptional regulator with PAS, ATPase and Fis domain
MTPVNSQSILMQIQPTILRFTKMLASVLQLEVEIVDANMTRVSGTGPYGKFFGRKLNSNSRLLRYVLDTKQEKVVIHLDSILSAKAARVKIAAKKKLSLAFLLFFKTHVLA